MYMHTSAQASTYISAHVHVYIIRLLGALSSEARGHAADFGPGFGAGVALEEATSLAKALRDGNRIYSCIKMVS